MGGSMRCSVLFASLAVGCSDYELGGGADLGTDFEDTDGSSAGGSSSGGGDDTSTGGPASPDPGEADGGSASTGGSDGGSASTGGSDGGSASTGGFDPDGASASAEPTGRVITILLTLNDAFVPGDVSARLIENCADFVTVGGKRVLVVADDNHHGEDTHDSALIAADLEDAGYDVTLIDEPSGGIELEDLAGFHTAILSNPGYPPDDASTIEAFEAFSAQGYGIVFQGDDMTQFADGSDRMERLTRLRTVDNGTSYGGIAIDNDQGGSYDVRIEGDHPLVAGLEGRSFPYGNDIDTTTVLTTTTEVAAWATAGGAPDKATITAFAP